MLIKSAKKKEFLRERIYEEKKHARISIPPQNALLNAIELNE